MVLTQVISQQTLLMSQWMKEMADKFTNELLEETEQRKSNLALSPPNAGLISQPVHSKPPTQAQ